MKCGRQAHANTTVIEVIFRAHDQFAVHHLVNATILRKCLQLGFRPDLFCRASRQIHGKNPGVRRTPRQDLLIGAVEQAGFDGERGRMQRWAIQAANFSLLVIILIGIPVISGVQFGRWQLSSRPTAQTLTLWSLGAAVVGNLGAALFLVKGAKARGLCRNWAVAFLALLGFEWALFNGYVHFEWLKEALLWFRRKF